MRYAITGVAGFIGSHLLEHLISEGHEVVGLDNFATGHRHNIAKWAEHFELIEGDIRDPEACARVCKGADHVFHQAALGSVPRSVIDPVTSHDVNTTGTLNMLVAGRDAEVSSFVFAASSAYFGDTETLPKYDTMAPKPLSPYAAQKVMCEQYLSVFSRVYGMPTVGLRYFNIFGPRQDPNGAYAAVIPKFVDTLLRGESPTINGDGEHTRDFTYIDNVVLANMLATQHAQRASGQTMNVACGERISLIQLYRILCEELGVEREPIFGPERAGDIRDSLADTSRAAELLGYAPVVYSREGLTRTVAHFREEFERAQQQG